MNKLIEELAALEHDQWIAWSQTIVRTENISQERIDRWKKCWVPYAELTEEMKEYDRIWARHIPEILSRYESRKEVVLGKVKIDYKHAACGFTTNDVLIPSYLDGKTGRVFFVEDKEQRK